MKRCVNGKPRKFLPARSSSAHETDKGYETAERIDYITELLDHLHQLTKKRLCNDQERKAAEQLVGGTILIVETWWSTYKNRLSDWPRSPMDGTYRFDSIAILPTMLLNAADGGLRKDDSFKNMYRPLPSSLHPSIDKPPARSSPKRLQESSRVQQCLLSYVFLFQPAAVGSMPQNAWVILSDFERICAIREASPTAISIPKFINAHTLGHRWDPLIAHSSQGGDDDFFRNGFHTM